MDLLINLFFEVFMTMIAEFIAAVIFAVFYKLTYAMFVENSRMEKIFGISGILMLAAFFSITFILLKPSPFFTPNIIPGISILVITLAAGFSALIISVFTKEHFEKKEIKNKPSLTKLQIFLSGALFGFIFSLIRFLYIYDQFISIAN